MDLFYEDSSGNFNIETNLLITCHECTLYKYKMCQITQ